MGNSWDKLARIIFEVIIIIIKYFLGKRVEEKIKVDNEEQLRKNIEFCKRNNYNYYCK